jgi:hypothetical protein
MEMSSERRLVASRQAVWAALNDADVLKQCIPGCESLEKLSDTEMTAKVKLGIGPVHATFTGKVTLSDLDPPNGYRLSGEGTGGPGRRGRASLGRRRRHADEIRGPSRSGRQAGAARRSTHRLCGQEAGRPVLREIRCPRWRTDGLKGDAVIQTTNVLSTGPN